MRVLGLAADGSFAVLETDGRTIEAFGPAGVGDGRAAFRFDWVARLESTRICFPDPG